MNRSVIILLALLCTVLSFLISSIVSLKSLSVVLVITAVFLFFKKISRNKIVFLTSMFLPVVYIPMELTGGMYVSFTYIIFALTIISFLKHRKELAKNDYLEKILISFSVIIFVRIFIVDILTLEYPFLSSINYLFSEMAKIISGIILIKISSNLNLRSDIYKGLLFGVIIMLLMNFYQISMGLQYLLKQGYAVPFFNYNTSDGSMRPFGTFLTPVTYGAYIAMLTGFLFWYVPKKYKLFKWIIVILGVFAMLSTQTRSAWIGFSVAIAVVFLLQSKVKWHRVIFSVFPIVGILFCVILINPSILDSFTGRLATVTDSNFDSNAIRIELWKATFHSLLDGNWLIGYGSSSFTEVISKYTSYEIASLAHPHQTFLEIFFRYGIIGLMVYLLIFVYVFNLAIKQIRSGINLHSANAVLTALIVFVITSLFETLWGSYNVYISLFVIIGFLRTYETKEEIEYSPEKFPIMPRVLRS